MPPNLNRVVIELNLPDEMYATGGQGPTGRRDEAVYPWMPPLLALRDEQDMKEWQAHVQRRNDDPILMLATTQDEGTDDPRAHFKAKFCLGLYQSGAVVRRRVTGLVRRRDAWE